MRTERHAEATDPGEHLNEAKISGDCGGRLLGGCGGGGGG
jgi:hypothetical protein